MFYRSVVPHTNPDLHIVIMCVEASFGEQAFMRPSLCDPVFSDNNDLISSPDGGQPVGDGDGRPVPGKLFQALLDPAFAFIVKCACRLVQNQDGRVFRNTRAMEMRCFCPPERRAPRSPT